MFSTIRAMLSLCNAESGYRSAKWIAVLSLLIAGVVSSEQLEPTAGDLEFFEKQVRPLLAEHCYSCHSAKAKKLQAGLRVDSRAALIGGGDSGASIVPGDPDDSLFMEAVRYESYEMPPKGKLTDEQIAVFESWIKLGAPWPLEETPIAVDVDENAFDLDSRTDQHWVWHPVQSPVPPAVKDTSWPRVDLDHFILADLEANSLAPSGDADREALLRRLYFDLIGLPPTPDQANKFLSDPSPWAMERLVDELLESPYFGERWGRHWLDLVRYAESRGHEFDDDAANAFQYRDYVIRAFNADVPYDQLVREHIAGDLLSPPRLNPETGSNESILGTGFWFLGEWVHSPVDIRKDESDRFDNMVDVMSKTFLGMTVSCARCHDHKFDAISTADYYSLTGFLQSSDFRQVRFESLEHNRQVAEELTALDESYQQRANELLAQFKIEPPQEVALPPEVADRIVFDFQSLPPEQFMQDGFIFGARPRRTGEAYLDESSKTPMIRFASHGYAVNDPIWNGLESLTEKGVESRSQLSQIPRSGRTLRTPTFELTGERVLCRVQGEGHVVACVDSHRLVAGPLHGQTVRAIPKDSSWVEMDLSRYIGHRLQLEFTPANDARLEVSWVIQGSAQQIQQALASFNESATLAAGFASAGFASAGFASAGIASAGIAMADLQGTEPQTSNEDASKRVDQEMRSLAVQWADDRAILRSRIKKQSQTAMAMMDGTGEDAQVLIRGSSSNPGDTVPRHFLSAVAGDRPMKIDAGSGRLELANQINAPENPLTSRVIVNRIWHHLMGRGIVPTTDDFGVLGQRPTNPKLLDHLARRFDDDGRSIKSMIRFIALSRTYQMSSKPDLAALKLDPSNLLWHYRPPKRLEGEAIRDSLLLLSGRLDQTQFGEPIPIHLTSFMDGRGRPANSGPLDGGGRRSIYVAVRRNFLSPFMLAFDTPAPFSTMGRRNVSNVPAQSLILMNDPFVAEQAKAWANRAMMQSELTEDRIRWMYETAFSRVPTEREISAATAFVASAGGESDSNQWADLAHALINTKEFIFLR